MQDCRRLKFEEVAELIMKMEPGRRQLLIRDLWNIGSSGLTTGWLLIRDIWYR